MAISRLLKVAPRAVHEHGEVVGARPLPAQVVEKGGARDHFSIHLVLQAPFSLGRRWLHLPCCGSALRPRGGQCARPLRIPAFVPGSSARARSIRIPLFVPATAKNEYRNSKGSGALGPRREPAAGCVAFGPEGASAPDFFEFPYSFQPRPKTNKGIRWGQAHWVLGATPPLGAGHSAPRGPVRPNYSNSFIRSGRPTVL